MKIVVACITASLSMHGVVAGENGGAHMKPSTSSDFVVTLVQRAQEAKTTSPCSKCALRVQALSTELAQTKEQVAQLKADQVRTAGYVADLWAWYRQQKRR